MKDIEVTIWNKEYWVTRGNHITGLTYPEPKDILALPLFAIVMYCARLLFEKYICWQLITWIGLKDKRKNEPFKNPTLEGLFKQEKWPNSKTINKYGKLLGLTTSQIQIWFRRRRNLDRPVLSKKFAEACWRATFYVFAFVFGMITLWPTAYLWDTAKCYTEYPHVLGPYVYCYYMLEGAFYMSLLFSVVTDIKRKDFKEQIIHHVVTLSLIVFSYLTNLLAYGSLIMAIHDVSDIFLEIGKCFNYAKKSRVAEFIFVLFAIVFIVSRLGILPYYVLYATMVVPLATIKPKEMYVYYVTNGLLLVLLILHIFWAIVKMAVQMKNGNLKKDDRSDAEETSTDENTKSS